MLKKSLKKIVKQEGRVIVHGFYGSANLGDEAILSATLKLLSKSPQIQPTVFGKYPSKIIETHKIPSVNPNDAYNSTGYLNLARANAYVLGGGGLLKDYGKTSSNVEVWLRWLNVAKSFGLKTMIWSMGVENLRYEKSKNLIRDALETVDAITVRDSNSKQRLEEIGVTNNILVTADPAISLAREHRKKRSLKERFRVVVSLRHWYKYNMSFVPNPLAYNRMLDSIATALDNMIDKWNIEIELMPLRTGSKDDDREVLNSLVRRMQKKPQVLKIYDETPEIDEALAILSNADLLIGMRLHAVILATSMGVPSIAISYMPKVSDYMSFIDQDDFCLDVEDINSEKLQGLIKNITSNYEAISEALVQSSEKLSEELTNNFMILSQLMKLDRKK